MIKFSFLLSLSVVTMGWSAISIAAFSLSPPSALSPLSSSSSSSSKATTTITTATTSTSLAMNYNQDEAFRRFDRASRSANANDNVVELLRPLGLVLDQYDSGDVYVKQIAPKGNAARTGKVKEGDIVTMCSATFGDQMWSTRGVGLNRVLAAIRVRSGPTVRLVFESPNAYKRKKEVTTKELQAKKEAAQAAQAKKDSLLKELEQTEQKLKKKSFFGLF